MKKVFKSIIACALTLCVALGLVACGGDWKGNTLGDWGGVVKNGGFIAETANNIYFVNGQADYTDDNKLGTPVKGALMGIKKTDFIAGDIQKAQIVVPKIIGNTDYNMGIYIKGDYVYYGTPNTDKDSSGQAASGEMVFAKTKLDGTGYKELFKTTTLATEYRIIENGNDVEIVYYDNDQTALKVYSENAGSSKTIAEIDQTKDQTLSTFKFTDCANEAGMPAVVFISVVYAEPYYEEAAKDEDYERLATDYTIIKSYGAGDTQAKVVKDGSNGTETNSDDIVYELLSAEKNCFAWSEKDINDKTKNYVDTLANGVSAGKQELTSADYLKNSVIVSKEEVYVVDTTAGFIVKTALVGEEQQTRQYVASAQGVGTLATVRGGYAYYYNSSNELFRIELNNQDANHERISSSTVALTWYEPTFMTIGAKEYMFYLDNSMAGSSYVQYVQITDNVATGEDTDNDGKDDAWTLEGSALFGKMIAKDEIKAVVQEINGMTSSSELDYEVVEGELVFETVDSARAAYNALSAEAKELIEEETLTKLTNAEKAVKLAKLFYKLEGVYDYEDKEAQKALYQTAYNAAKAEVNKYSDEEYTQIRGLIENNLKYYYQEAQRLFGDLED